MSTRIRAFDFFSHDNSDVFGSRLLWYSAEMCGRYTYSKRRKEIQSRFEDVDPEELPFTPRYNIAPTQSASVLVAWGKGVASKLLTMGWFRFDVAGASN